MHWYELTIYAVSGLSILIAVAVALLAYRFFRRR